MISIHAPHAGRDRNWHYWRESKSRISIHAPHAGRDHFVTDYAALIGISIHAPHAGRDGYCCRYVSDYGYISIHAPHAGRDEYLGGNRVPINVFQSTRPMRGAT